MRGIAGEVVRDKGLRRRLGVQIGFSVDAVWGVGNLAVALVSIFAVEVAMLAAFGTEEDAVLRSVMPVLTGTGIALVMGVLGIRSVMPDRI